jgi:glycosyltransferase involved in cell wall biosynthesis
LTDPPAPPSPTHGLRVTLVAANTFEYDSRFLRTATTLAADGHRVRVLGWSDPALPRTQELAPGVTLTRLDIDRRITEALRPLPRGMRRAIARAIGLDPQTTQLAPWAPRGLDRLRHPLRRLLEIVANARRTGPWTDAVLAEAPDTDVFHAQAFVLLPVIRAAAARTGGRFVYDVADYQTEAARVARLPWVLRELLRRRERRWARDAAGFLAVSEPVAEIVSRRFGVPRPPVLLNCPPAWRPDGPEPPRTERIRDALGLPAGRPVVLFQGAFGIDRGLEELVAAAGEPALAAIDAAVVFLGFGRLQAYLDDAARTHPGRVHVLPAVPPAELLEWVASADVSFVGQPPRTLNQRMNLPNKLFESLMAGVPVVVSRGNEQCRLTTEEGVGRCTDVESPAAIAADLSALLAMPEADRVALRRHCRSVALARYSWEHTAGGLRTLYRDLAAA